MQGREKKRKHDLAFLARQASLLRYCVRTPRPPPTAHENRHLVKPMIMEQRTLLWESIVANIKRDGWER